MVSIVRFPPKPDVFHLLLGVAVAPDSQIARLEAPRRTKGPAKE